MIKDRDLTDFYSGLVNRVQKFSLKMDKWNQISLHEDWNICPYEGNKYHFVEKAGESIESYIRHSITKNVPCRGECGEQ